MAAQIFLNFLNKHQISYTTIGHPEMITEKHIKGISHNAGNGLAKAMMVKVDNEYVMMVIPSKYALDLNLLRQSLGVRHIKLVNPKDSQELLPRCETYATPQFGNPVGIPVYIDEELTGNECIAFNVGNHHEVIMISYREFERLAQPTVICYSTQNRNLI